MAALTGITAVRPTLNTKLQLVAYGATISAGQPLYKDETDRLYKLADSNASTATATVRGIAITPGVNGGYGYIATGGSIILVGATMTVGAVHFNGPTAGTIDTVSSTGDYVTPLGAAASETQFDVAIVNTGIQRA